MISKEQKEKVLKYISSNYMQRTLILNEFSFNEIIDLYNSGVGFKIIAREIETSYTKIRSFFIQLEKRNMISLRKGLGIVTDKLKAFRKEKALYESKNKIGFNSNLVKEKLKIKNKTSRGIQGYYWNRHFNKYCWLRSSWEYIYAKWLDSKNIAWDVEVKSFYLKNGERYVPDFFIYSNGKSKSCNYIVEIKGFWNRQKHIELKTMIKEEVILITDMTNYIGEDSSLAKEVRKWKQLRVLEI